MIESNGKLLENAQSSELSVGHNEVPGQENKKAQTCGLIMPIAANEVGSTEHWLHVRKIIIDALKDTELKVKMVSESDEVAVIHSNIVTNIYSNDIVICDVSARNPNVMFELGMRLTFDKPVVIIKDRETPFSFDVGNIQHLEYPRSLNYIEILGFQRELKEKTLFTLTASKRDDYSPFLSHYKIKHVANIKTEIVGRDDYIISQLNELKENIKSLKSTGNNAFENIIDKSFISSSPMWKKEMGMPKERISIFMEDVVNSASNIIDELNSGDDIQKYCSDYLRGKYQFLSDSEVALIMLNATPRILRIKRERSDSENA